MLIGVPADPLAGKTRVAVNPGTVWTFTATGHAVCIQHGGAGFCGTRFLQRAILRFEISHSAPIVLTRDRVQAQFPRHPGSTTIL